MKYLLILGLVLTLASCGTGIGNSYPQGMGVDAKKYSNIIDQYNSSEGFDCGSFDENDSEIDIENGRTCIRESLEECVLAKYLINQQNAPNQKFISFVTVQEGSSNCQLSVFTFSNLPSSNVGYQEGTCSSLDPDEMPELACGIN